MNAMPTMNPAALMRLAIEKPRAGIAAGQSPFGCAIALGDDVIALAHNCVWSTTDITAHAEITALRAARRSITAPRLPTPRPPGSTNYTSRPKTLSARVAAP